MDERTALHRDTHLTWAAVAGVWLLIFCGVGLACEFPDEHSITLKSAIINGTDITQSRTITVGPGSFLSGAIKVSVHHVGRERGAVVVAATANWKSNRVPYVGGLNTRGIMCYR